MSRLHYNYLLESTVKKIHPKGRILVIVLLCRDTNNPGYTAHPAFRVSRTQTVHSLRMLRACGLTLQVVTITHYGFEHDGFWSESVWICTQHAGSDCWTKARYKSSALLIELHRNIAACVQVPEHYFW